MVAQSVVAVVGLSGSLRLSLGFPLAIVKSVAVGPVAKSVVAKSVVAVVGLSLSLGLRTYGYGHGLYYGKREAEAEPKAAAEPYYGYYGPGYHGLGYRTYGYGHGLYYGKREAEAEPKAAADPYLL